MIDLAENLSNLVYYPTEHLAWAADRKLIPLHSEKLWMTTTFLWVFSLSLGIVKAVLHLLQINAQLSQPREGNAEASRQQKALLKQRWLSLVTIVQCAADLGNAANRLPPGYLWAGKLSTFWAGLCGTVASVLGLYRLTHV